MRLTAVALALCLVAPTAFAGDAEVSAAQSIINRQMQAFIGGRDSEAYGYASPTLRQMFPTVESFMGMVKNGYPMVHQPRNFAFGTTEDNGGEIKQQVLLTGPDGKDYEALYTLTRQPDGSWLISGVSLKAANSLST